MSQYQTIAYFISRLTDEAILRLIDDAEGSFQEDADYVHAVAVEVLTERGIHL